MSLNCLDVSAILQLAKYAKGWKDDEEMCSGVNSLLHEDSLGGEKYKQLLNTLESWYKDHFAPCLTNTCKATKSPVEEKAIVKAPKEFLQGYLNSELPPWQKYALEHWQIVGVIVVVVLLSLGGLIGFLLGKGVGK